MATIKHDQMVKDYWNSYQRRAWINLIIWSLGISFVVMVILFLSAIIKFDLIALWVSFLILAVVFLSLKLLVFEILLVPLHQLADALTHVSDEPNAVEPPHPNSKHARANGLAPLLELIYKLGANYDPGVKQSAKQSEVEKGLHHSRSSVVICSENGEVTFASHAAPIMTDPKGRIRLKLQFSDSDSLEKWASQVSADDVRAEKNWHRIASDPVGVEDRRIFDIAASYEKGSEAPFVIMLIDQTDSYQPEDDQLDFIAFAAHELRGPVTVIRGYLDVLLQELDGNLSNDHRQLFDRLAVSANRLSGYIANILNASRYDQHHMRIQLVELSVGSVYGLIKDDMELRASIQNRLLAVDIADNLPTVAADASTLSEVLSNLIDNALKYSHDGGVVTVRASASDQFVQIDIIDQGIGMPPNVVANLFHKFYRSHRSRETVSGSGIGLYISKAIIESCGGTIDVRSKEGIGTTISFTLPTYSSVADKLVESNHSNQEILLTNRGGWIQNHNKYRG
jgi:signal transduction histidine kinase